MVIFYCPGCVPVVKSHMVKITVRRVWLRSVRFLQLKVSEDDSSPDVAHQKEFKF
jgi:hypothetical protein